MYNRGIDELLQHLPHLGDLTPETVKRMLTQAWLNAMDYDQFDTQNNPAHDYTDDLRRLASALEVYAILPTELAPDIQRACAFVAAESLEINAEARSREGLQPRQWLFGSAESFEKIEAGLLYLISGYDANAAVAIRSLSNAISSRERISDPMEAWVFDALKEFINLRMRRSSESPPPLPSETVEVAERARYAILRHIGTALQTHMQWLSYMPGGDASALEKIRYLISRLEYDGSGEAVQARHADLHHLALLIASAMQETAKRAIRAVAPPGNDGDRFATFQRNKAATRPLLWPAAEEYAAKALPGPHAHAVVAVPTGAGKSSVAELAVCQALKNGWVLYLTPTNALAGQVHRHLSESIGNLDGVRIREFVGGLEYTELSGETLGEVSAGRQVLVMTPEKCSLALRQSPDVFRDLSLCVFDEAHLIGDGDTRAVLSELVVSELLYRAPNVHFLMLSALLANPADLASWLSQTSRADAVVIDTPWRPTRTLRAMAGFSWRDRSIAVNEALGILRGKPVSRKNQKVAIPISLLASLQGAWKSGDFKDYAVTRTDVTVDLTYHRDDGLNSSGYYSRAATSFAAHLGSEGHRVLVFLPRSKHDSFKYAIESEGFRDLTNEELPVEIRSYLKLAEKELGGISALDSIISKGIAVHTSAMLREEQRASELAFEEGRARILFATGTLAQGLNLPATAVIVGGTSIGYDPTQDVAKAEQRARSQLLNAIGRAGRANVAARSMAVVIPNEALVFTPKFSLQPAIARARFLQYEDASSEIASQLDGMISRARDGSLDIRTMSRFEEVAFSFLSFSADGSDAKGVIRNTWAVHRARAVNDVELVAQAIGDLGSRFLRDSSAPDWISLASHKAGLPLPETVELEWRLARTLQSDSAPESIKEWADCLIEVLQWLNIGNFSRIMSDKAFRTTTLAGAWSEVSQQRTDAWRAFRKALHAWMRGEPIIDLASLIMLNQSTRPQGRGQSDAIPKVLGVVEDGFSFQLSIAAGALGAIVAAGRENDPDGPWELPESSRRYLNLLPLAIRLGTNSPAATAWMRAGARPRAVGHLLARILPPPHEMDDEEMRRYAQRQLSRHSDYIIAAGTSDDERELLRALIRVRAS